MISYHRKNSSCALRRPAAWGDQGDLFAKRKVAKTSFSPDTLQLPKRSFLYLDLLHRLNPVATSQRLWRQDLAYNCEPLTQVRTRMSSIPAQTPLGESFFAAHLSGYTIALESLVDQSVSWLPRRAHSLFHAQRAPGGPQRPQCKSSNSNRDPQDDRISAPNAQRSQWACLRLVGSGIRFTTRHAGVDWRWNS